MSTLYETLGVAKNALSGLVDRMERRGLVQRETLQCDRRAVTLSTTALGKEIVGVLPDLHQEFARPGENLVRLRFVMT